MLVSYNGQAITYDAIGNPLTYNNGTAYNFTWNGRQLATATKGGLNYSFTYNDEGIRTSKTRNGTTTTYYLNGSQIVAEVTNSCVTLYVYDINGLPLGMQYHDADNPIDEWEIFWYEKNIQGDIIGVYDQAGTKLISYTYDAWGNFSENYLHSGVQYSPVSKNPFTYRGYYYDRDLGFYYLNSRYYDSNTGRFISPDDASYLGANGDINSYNLYAYCSNNPVMYQDPSGHSIIGAILIGALIGTVIGAGTTVYEDYADDGEIFNGSVDAVDYVANTIIGAASGAIVGTIAGYAAPYMSGFLSSSFKLGSYILPSGEAISITVTGAQIAEAAVAGVTLMFASSNRPGNNKKQNKQFKDAMRELDVSDKDKMRRVHDKIKGRDMGYNELIDFIKEVLKIQK